MNLTRPQRIALDHLRAAYAGPEGGADETVMNVPSLQYSVGMLFPPKSRPPLSAGADGLEEVDADVEGGDVEEQSASVPLAEDWRPSSVAISFVTDRPAVVCDFSGGTYAPVVDDGPPRWQRRPFSFDKIELSEEARAHELVANGVPFSVGSRWRPFHGNFLVTVHVRLRTESTDSDRQDVPSMLFQVALGVAPESGGRIFEYDRASSFDADEETPELRLRYRNKQVFAVGHGMAADWEQSDGSCTRVFLTPVPAFVVPAIEVSRFAEGSREADALRLSNLERIDSAPDRVLPMLDAFVAAFSSWVTAQEDSAKTFGSQSAVASTITNRASTAVRRMQEGVELLRGPEAASLRTAFALGMAAMNMQMCQKPNAPEESVWRPFQLGFILVSLSSTVDEKHDDRELVDLIWFPTGGGKTEAYLGLAAIEIFRRRLVDGGAGGGTAVLTRYTLRLLTAQQFQRTASLICAMELLRRNDSRTKKMPRFSIGLWVGNEVTPGTRSEARAALDRLRKAARPEEANQFQVGSCPWCGVSLVPDERSSDITDYGFRVVGKDVVIHCTEATCAFHDELPILVVDEALYESPPSVLLATVDKFARLQLKPEAGRLLGIGTPFRHPSLIIQDELHLLSGPLGTTVAVFDAVVQILVGRGGTPPKILASTATIRASDDQVQGLYGRAVALYPPAGLDADRTFFSNPVDSGEGRLYIGIMPQSISQMSAVVAASAPLIELPEVMAADPQLGSAKDAYWTAVMYHNSLRELGRSNTLVVDDVNKRLDARADRLSLPLRPVRADRVLELTSRRGPEELPGDLRELGRSIDETDEAIDVVLSSNMLSVGIDIPRLALMLMVGQPKTTAEYIQATSRVGRGTTQGVVVTLFRSNRARDRSHFETFRGYHEALYRSVEPTSVTPWSLSSRQRSLAGALVALVRHSLPLLAPNEAAGRMDLDDEAQSSQIDMIVESLVRAVDRAESAEAQETQDDLWRLVREWDHRARKARENDSKLLYRRTKAGDEALLKEFGQPGDGWTVANSMRTVEPNVAVQVREPMEGGERGTNRA